MKASHLAIDDQSSRLRKAFAREAPAIGGNNFFTGEYESGGGSIVGHDVGGSSGANGVEATDGLGKSAHVKSARRGQLAEIKRGSWRECAAGHCVDQSAAAEDIGRTRIGGQTGNGDDAANDIEI